MLKTKTLFIGITIMASIGIASLGLIRHTTMADTGATIINPWWPVNGSHVSGVQPFKANVENAAVENYDLYWQVDNGARNLMPTNYADYPHKEAAVDLSGWNWQKSGAYKITYTAVNKQDGRELASTSLDIYIDGVTPAIQETEEATKAATTKTSETTAASSSEVVPLPSISGANLTGLNLYAHPYGPAAQQAALWAKQGRVSDASIMNRLSNMPLAEWFGGWSGDVQAAARNYVSGAPADSLPVLVAYNIPHRDCGSYSAGGTEESQYIGWIRGMANGIGSHKALVILEPDALAGISCLDANTAAKRMDLLRQAVAVLKSNAKTRVYLDAGNPAWLPVDRASELLNQAGVASADGFSLNVSNFTTTEANITYGSQISAKTGGAHFVVDTSRNGNGPAPGGEWCNPAGRALGRTPTTRTGNGLADAFLWVKTPGESDGSCNGAPNAGEWMPDYALGLAKNAGW